MKIVNDTNDCPFLTEDEKKWLKAYKNNTLFYSHNYTGNDLNDIQVRIVEIYWRWSRGEKNINQHILTVDDIKEMNNFGRLSGRGSSRFAKPMVP